MKPPPPPCQQDRDRPLKGRGLPGLIIALLVLLALTLLYWLPANPLPPSNEVITTVPAPDGRMKAVIFQRYSGATTGFSTQVCLLDNDLNLPADPDIIFSADCGHDGAPAAPHGGPAVELHWPDPGHLEIHYHPQAQVFQAKSSMDAISITYVPDLLK